jgi:hypothetical protein
MKRRLFTQIGLRTLAAGAVSSSVLALPRAAAKADPLSSTSSPAALSITVYRDPSCSCCHRWISYLEAEGFQVTDHLADDMAARKQQYGIPDALASCHTATVEGYVVEGHVPAADIRRLVAERPAVLGIAAPGMPVGSPGMEMEDRQDAFSVVTFDQNGQTAVFNHYPASLPSG